MREWIYGSSAGCPEGNEEVYVARYERHNEEVREYFRGRPQDMCELRFDDGWESLSRLLGVPVPDRPWPHANAAGRHCNLGPLLQRAKTDTAPST